MCVACLKRGLEALKLLTEGGARHRRHLRAIRKDLSYLIGDASGLGFGSVMWSQSRLVSGAGDFNPLYQGISLNFREGGNLTKQIEKSVEQGELKNMDIFFLH